MIEERSENGETRDLAYNPCGVAVGRDAYFKIGVEPDAYPDSMISWEVSGEGSVQFVGGSYGREIRVRGVSPGDVTLSAKLGDCVSTPPSFSFRVVTNRTIRLSAWIVTDENDVPARSVDEVRDMVKTANDIYAQVGVTFDLGDRITVTNIPAAYEINVENETEGRWNFDRLSVMVDESDVVSCYFINRIIEDEEGEDSGAETIGIHRSGVLAISAQAEGGVTFAHELGHYLGMRDVYASHKTDGRRSYVQGRTCYGYESSDWNNGCVGSAGMSGAERYYEAGTLHVKIIDRMLMNGSVDKSTGNEKGRDITSGMVYGYDRQGVLGDVDTGFFKD